MDVHPYAPHLERTLNHDFTNESSNEKTAVVVRWMGLPGWTSSQMLSALDTSQGLRGVLKNVKQQTGGESATLAIILAGTNDLAYESSSLAIFESLTSLHRVSHDEGVPTVAIGIPPSAWQMIDEGAAALAKDVNERLKEWCDGGDGDGMASFLDFPFGYGGKEDENWGPDGLHCTARGYQILGEELASGVKSVLEAFAVK